MMNIRKIIREQIKKVFEDNTGGMFGGALDGISNQLQTDLDNVGAIIATHQTDIKNKDTEIKADSDLQSKLDQNNPHKIGLTREIPEMKKDLDVRKKQLKDLETAEKGLTDAQTQIAKQQSNSQAQQNNSKADTGKAKIASNLPSLPNPI